MHQIKIRFGEYEGIVEDIQTRATMIRTYDSRRIVIPNAELFIHSVTVNTAFEHRRLEYDVDRVLMAIKKTLSANGDP